MNTPPEKQGKIEAFVKSIQNTSDPYKGTCSPEHLSPGVNTEIVFELPLPKGFVMGTAAEIMVQLPPGFAFQEKSGKPIVQFYMCAPFQFNQVDNPPLTSGPTHHSYPGIPKGTLYAWAAVQNTRKHENITLEFILQNLINPTTAGTTDSFYVTVCSDIVFTIPGITIKS